MLKRKGVVKGFLKNVKKNCTFLTRRLPLSTIETFDAAFNSVNSNFHFSELIVDFFKSVLSRQLKKMEAILKVGAVKTEEGVEARLDNVCQTNL